MSVDVARKLVDQHPLQRLSSPSRGTSAFVHALGLSSFCYSFYWLNANPNPVNQSYGWHWQYLTIVGLSLAWLTFFTGLAADLSLNRRLFAIKNVLSVASAPLACLITLLYWGLRTLDPKLLQQSWTEPLPPLIDVTFHLIPAVALIIDLLFFSPPYTIAFLPAFALSGFLASGYWFWLEECYRHNNFYPYPMLEMMDVPQRILLFSGSALIMSVATAGLAWVYHAVNGRFEDYPYPKGTAGTHDRRTHNATGSAGVSTGPTDLRKRSTINGSTR